VFSRVAVVNRGEAAIRFIRAARELGPGDGPLRTVALYTSVEARAMFVREADEAFEIASPGGNPYLDYDELARALTISRADAAWVGWGFVAEHAAFAARCADLGVVFIGPPPEVMRRLGDKIGAKLLAEEAGVPVAPWSGGPVGSLGEARLHAESIGYPLMVKASAGGGGRGIRLAAAEDQLRTAWERARSEAEASFGDPTVFLERVVTGARHVEVQVLADDYGNVWTPGVRDCSLQRRNQKILEESASTVLPPPVAAAAKAAAVRLVKAAGYRNAGTVEFLYQPAEERLAFLEVNTRLQVEHPVTEVTTGIDLVKLQLHVASGGRLEGDPPPPRGHAIEVRLNAEDPGADFAPAPGVVEHVAWPTGPGIRVDTGYATGDVIPPQYDSMMAKLVAWGADREEARLRLRRALADTTVLVQGGTTNKAFLAALLDHPDVIAGKFDTGWLDRLGPTLGTAASSGRAEVALVAAAVAAADADAALQLAGFFAAAARGRAQGPSEAGFTAELQHGGHSYRIGVYRTGPQRYRAQAGGEAMEVDVETVGRYERRLTFGRDRFRVVSLVHDTERDRTAHPGGEDLVEVDGVPHRVSRDSAGVVRAPAPGVVVEVRVSPGDLVNADDAVAVIESMKMEVAIRAGVAGRVSEVLVGPNGQVDGGAPLARIEVEGGDTGAPGEAVDFAALAVAAGAATEPGERCLATLAGIRSLVLGFDFAPADIRRLVSAYVEDRGRVASVRAPVIAAEREILTVFGDLCMLSRNRRTDDARENEATHNPRGYFLAYLQTFDTERSGLPAGFVERLRRALAHFGSTDLEPTPTLRENLHRMYLAQQRAANQLPAVLAILEHHLGASDVPEPMRNGFLESLERLIVATQLRHPVVGNLARSVRFTVFDHPLVLAERDRVMTEMRGHLARAASTEDPAERDHLMARLVDCAQPLIELMAALGDDEAEQRRCLVEVMVRRYYQIRTIVGVRQVEVGGRPGVVATYLEGHRQVEVAATDLRAAELLDPTAGETEGALARWVLGVENFSVLELYVRWENDWPGTDELVKQIESAVNRGPCPAILERLTVTATTSTGTAGGPGVHRFTWERDMPEGGLSPRLVENQVLRDLHPLIADRLHLWRLANFDVTRLRSAPHVYLYRCVARDIPTDVRLIALAEVRDLTPLRDLAGDVAALP
jgi:acetyl/propionyl-CoA carboxylase alpha subunit